jgi:hypothetical protein
MKPSIGLVSVLLAAAFLIGRATRADDRRAGTVAATYYKVWITTEFTHDMGYWAHEIFLPEQKVCIGLDFDREDVLDEDRRCVGATYTPKARAWHAERARTASTDWKGRNAIGVADIQIPAALASKVRELADLTERYRAAGYSVGEEVATGLSLGPDVLPHHEGQVLSVDASTKVVIISLGADDGVLPSLQYTVSRGDKYVGMIEITEVRAKQSFGRSVEGLRQIEIQRGDKVSR